VYDPCNGDDLAKSKTQQNVFDTLSQKMTSSLLNTSNTLSNL